VMNWLRLTCSRSAASASSVCRLCGIRTRSRPRGAAGNRRGRARDMRRGAAWPGWQRIVADALRPVASLPGSPSARGRYHAADASVFNVARAPARARTNTTSSRPSGANARHNRAHATPQPRRQAPDQPAIAPRSPHTTANPAPDHASLGAPRRASPPNTRPRPPPRRRRRTPDAPNRPPYPTARHRHAALIPDRLAPVTTSYVLRKGMTPNGRVLRLRPGVRSPQAGHDCRSNIRRSAFERSAVVEYFRASASCTRVELSEGYDNAAVIPSHGSASTPRAGRCRDMSTGSA
jgi:hypothetical protein